MGSEQRDLAYLLKVIEEKYESSRRTYCDEFVVYEQTRSSTCVSMEIECAHTYVRDIEALIRVSRACQHEDMTHVILPYQGRE
jgi:hypothetical protein